jgi:magnesium transporter
MLTYLSASSSQTTLEVIDTLRSDSWIRSERPTSDEKASLVKIGIDEDILHDALDPHEVPRVELSDGWTYFITRLPDTDDDFNDYTTPILFALGKNYLVTVSRDSLGRLWQPFIDTTKVDMKDQTGLFMLMVDEIAKLYQRRVATINRQMRAATSDVVKLSSKDIVTLTEYERKLNDFLDALIPTNTAIEKLLGGKLLKLLDDDKELVEDLSIDFEQLIARCKSLLRTITNVRDSYRAVMDTRLNETIQLLTVMTVALTIPTMLAGLFGMNVPLPDANSPYIFWEIIVVSAVCALAISVYFMRSRR